MIKPHGSDELNPLFVYDVEQRHALVAEAETLPSILINSAAAANAVMMGGGYFNPLTGYMNLADALSVAEKMHTVDGLFFPVPVVNMTNEGGVEAGHRGVDGEAARSQEGDVARTGLMLGERELGVLGHPTGQRQRFVGLAVDGGEDLRALVPALLELRRLLARIVCHPPSPSRSAAPPRRGDASPGAHPSLSECVAGK